MAFDSAHPNHFFWADLLARDDENDEEDVTPNPMDLRARDLALTHPRSR